MSLFSVPARSLSTIIDEERPFFIGLFFLALPIFLLYLPTSTPSRSVVGMERKSEKNDGAINFYDNYTTLVSLSYT